MTEKATPEEHRRALIQGTAMLVQLYHENKREKYEEDKRKKDKGEDPDLPMLPPAPVGVT